MWVGGGSKDDDRGPVIRNGRARIYHVEFLHLKPAGMRLQTFVNVSKEFSPVADAADHVASVDKIILTVSVG